MSHRCLGLSALTITLALGVAPPPALADEPSVPKVFRGSASLGKGQWRMEVLRTSLPTEGASAMPRSLSICFDGITDMTRPRAPDAAGEACTSKTIEDTPTRAVIESTCADGKLRTEVTKKGKNAFLVSVKNTGGADAFSLEARYTYEGACKGSTAPVQLSADSEQCKGLRAQLAAMDPDTACADFPAEAQTTCRAQMAASRAQLEGLCAPSP